MKLLFINLQGTPTQEGKFQSQIVSLSLLVVDRELEFLAGETGFDNQSIVFLSVTSALGFIGDAFLI